MVKFNMLFAMAVLFLASQASATSTEAAKGGEMKADKAAEVKKDEKKADEKKADEKKDEKKEEKKEDKPAGK